jgi:uncharacterized DUF497 family protein
MGHRVHGFDRDAGNRKHCGEHGVALHEIEEVFQNTVIVIPDLKHSENEPRVQAVGTTIEGRHVFVVFTVGRRHGTDLIRPISARYMHRGEIERYVKPNPDV